MLAFVPLPRSAGFDTLSGHLRVFPDYLAEKRVFIDWELIKRGPPLTLAPFCFLRKVRAALMWKRYICRGVENAFVVASALLLAPSFILRLAHLCVSVFRFDSYCHRWV